MEIVDIKGEGEWFDHLWRIYDDSFPSHEKQSRERILSLLGESSAFGIDGFLEDGQIIGFFIYWSFEDLIYLEHFAIEQSSRCGGRGSLMLAEFIERHAPSIVVGEIEPPVDEITERRAAFYDRMGFVMGERFLFPAYQKGGAGFEMIFISHSRRVSSSKFERYRRFLKDIVTDGD